MSNELAVTNGRGEVIEAVIAKGDLAKLTPDERVNYYRSVCESVGLNPMTRPFEYIILSGKTTLYARKDATDQLRKLQHVSLHDPAITYSDGLVTVTVNATTPDGRNDFDLGAVSIEGLKGEARANAIMKAITKAKRRVTLSICGLGWLDETEIESIPSAMPARVDIDTGEIMVVNPLAQDVQFKPEPNNSPDEKLTKQLHAVGTKLYPAKGVWDTKRGPLVSWATNKRTTSSKEMTIDEMTMLIDKMNEELRKVAAAQPTLEVVNDPELVIA